MPPWAILAYHAEAIGVRSCPGATGSSALGGGSASSAFFSTLSPAPRNTWIIRPCASTVAGSRCIARLWNAARIPSPISRAGSRSRALAISRAALAGVAGVLLLRQSFVHNHDELRNLAQPGEPGVVKHQLQVLPARCDMRYIALVGGPLNVEKRLVRQRSRPLRRAVKWGRVKSSIRLHVTLP